MKNISFLMIICLFIINACQNDDDNGFPITNDFRILQVRVQNNIIQSHAEQIPVNATLQLICSHPADQQALTQAISFQPAVDFTVSYDGSGSIATISFNSPLSYETEFSFHISSGSYGSGGERMPEDYHFVFKTVQHIPPVLTLSTTAPVINEGEQATITAMISYSVINDVSFDIVIGGTATLNEDYTLSTQSVRIPAGQTSTEIVLSAIEDGEAEGTESIVIEVENALNVNIDQTQSIQINIADQAAALILKGVMSLKLGGTSTNGRAIHLEALEDIADLSVYGIGIANNGGGTDGREIDFPAASVHKGDHILLVRTPDRAGLEAYFGTVISDFSLIVETDGLNFNGDDAIELFDGDIIIETYGDADQSGTGLPWEYTGTWSYKFNQIWEYGAVDCASDIVTAMGSPCPYPFAVPLQLYGVTALLWDGSGTNGGKAVELRANRSISDLSAYGLGTANNGGGTDGIEFSFTNNSVQEGDYILVAREPSTLAGYLGNCYNKYSLTYQSDAMNQNGDDAIELFQNDQVIETYGDANVSGTGQVWEYSGSWGYRVNGIWTYGGLDCGVGSTSTQSSSCPYPLCN